MLFTQGDEIRLPYQRFAAGVDVHVHSQLLALADDGVDFVEAQVQPAAVLRRPAAGAVLVAGRGGVQQNGPGDVAAVLFAHFLLPGPADEVGVEEEVLEDRLQHVVVHVLEDVHDELVHIVVRMLQHIPESLPLGLEAVRPLPGQPVHPLHELEHIPLWVLLNVAEGSFQRGFLESFLNTHEYILLFIICALSAAHFFSQPQHRPAPGISQ